MAMTNDANRSEQPRLLRVPEVGERIGQHPATIYRKIERGQLPALRLGTGRAALRVGEHRT